MDTHPFGPDSGDSLVPHHDSDTDWYGQHDTALDHPAVVHDSGPLPGTAAWQHDDAGLSGGTTLLERSAAQTSEIMAALPGYTDRPEGLGFTPIDPSTVHLGVVDGNPDSDAQYWMFQGYGNETCAPTSVTMVLEHVLGERLDSSSVIQYASSKGWLQSDGMTQQNIMNLIQSYGLDVQSTSGNTVQDLATQLQSGHEVMVSLDAEEIWNPSTEAQQNPSHSADHEVVVTGVDLDRGLVYLNDSGTESGKEEVVPLSQFEQAWGTSQNTMIYTDLPDASERADVLNTVGPADQTQTVPTQTDPTRTDPTQYDPTQTDPTQYDPTQTDPTQYDPTQTDPTQYDPTQTDPLPGFGSLPVTDAFRQDVYDELSGAATGAARTIILPFTFVAALRDLVH